MGWRKNLQREFWNILLSAFASTFPLKIQPTNADSLEQKVQLIFPRDGVIMTDVYDIYPNQAGLQAPIIGMVPRGNKVFVNKTPVEILKLNPGQIIQFGNYLEILGEINKSKILCGNFVEEINTNQNDLFLYNLNTSSPVIELEIFSQNLDDFSIDTHLLYYQAGPEQTYSITIDDAADVFADISKKQPISIFDQPVLKLLQNLHHKYGTVFSFYLFYNGTLYKDFNLSQMPEKYKKEWEENSHWLRLGFHALQMHPPNPYEKANYQKAQEDLLTVKKEILRFAGEKNWDTFMRSHYWSGSLESCRAWHDNNVKGFYAGHQKRRGYYLDPKASSILEWCDYWRDNQEGLIFIQTDIWLEKDFPKTSNLVEIVDNEMRRRASQNLLGIQNIQIFTHEAFLITQNNQYQVPETMEAVIAWLTKHGYKPEFDADNDFFNTLPPPSPTNIRLEETGEKKSLVWSHRNRGQSKYKIFTKDLRQPLSDWEQIGESNTNSWIIDKNNQENLLAYRITSYDEKGRTSNSKPFILKPEILKPELIAEELVVNIFPNPFNLKTTIQYTLPRAETISINIYNILGQSVWQSQPRYLDKGQYQQELDAKYLANGVYIIQIQAGNEKVKRKITLLK